MGTRAAAAQPVALFCVRQVEKRLELVKQVSHSTHKKLTACLQGQQGVDVERKSVRSPSVSSKVCVCRCEHVTYLSLHVTQPTKPELAQLTRSQSE